mmetsp:Transcript_19214/g.50978  ORF Transcript_19214/g.50978 Transcript_19214/m.50978 type:complete len:319 (+) Transcript_19214:699-1655(+)
MPTAPRPRSAHSSEQSIITFIAPPAPVFAVSNAFTASSNLNLCVTNFSTSTFPSATMANAVGYALTYLNTPLTSTSRHAASSSGTLITGAPIPTTTTTPPLFAPYTAVASATSAPVHSITASAPAEPPGSAARTASAASRAERPRTLTVAAAPRDLATARRPSSMSVTATAEAPLARAVTRLARPIVPAPQMRTVLPSFTPARFVACTPTESGSSSAAPSYDTWSGILKQKSAGCTNLLVRLPFTGGVAQKLIFAHKLYVPPLQCPHVLHGTPGSIATRSPFASPSTPSPTSTTSADASCPSVIGEVSTKSPIAPWVQ